MKSNSFPKITLELLYHEIYLRNRKYSQILRVSRKEKLCLCYLGWNEMNGIPVTLTKLRDRKFNNTVQSLIRQELLNHRFEPINNGRIFFYEVAKEVCQFWQKTKEHIFYQGLEVDFEEIKKIVA